MVCTTLPQFFRKCKLICVYVFCCCMRRTTAIIRKGTVLLYFVLSFNYDNPTYNSVGRTGVNLPPASPFLYTAYTFIGCIEKVVYLIFSRGQVPFHW